MSSLPIRSIRTFLSTPSARRATWGCHNKNSRGRFLSTPSARRATANQRRVILTYEISIHALREEGDERGRAGGAPPEAISIHALRANGLGDLIKISIHALREEGDLLSMGIVPGMCLFLSTPSARRATPPGRPVQPAGSDFYPRPPRGGRPIRP